MHPSMLTGLVFGAFLKKWNQASLHSNQFPTPHCHPSVALPMKLFVCAGTLPQTRPVCGYWLITGKEGGNSHWRNKELKGKVLTACSVHVQAIFLRSCKFLIFYIFLNLGKADINIESCFQPTSRVLSYPPMYFVIKCFCKCVKCIIIVLPLESLRLRLDRHQEKKTNPIL